MLNIPFCCTICHKIDYTSSPGALRPPIDVKSDRGLDFPGPGAENGQKVEHRKIADFVFGTWRIPLFFYYIRVRGSERIMGSPCAGGGRVGTPGCCCCSRRRRPGGRGSKNATLVIPIQKWYLYNEL